MKIWKKIPEFTLYEISNYGEIKTFNHRNKGKEAIMKPALDAGGYLRTMLIGDDKKYHTVKVHRLVAKAFLENPENKPQVNHINGIKSDNRVSNLEWSTPSENVKHSYNFLNRERLHGEKNHEASLTDAQVIEIRKNYVRGKTSNNRETKAEIAKKYNTSFAVIKRIVSNKTWKHLL